MILKLNGQEINLDIKGEREFGAEVNLLQNDDDLTSGTDWKEVGYTIESFLDESHFSAFEIGIKNLIINYLKECHFEIEDNFDLAHYHLLIGEHYEKHLNVINKTKLIENKNFPIDISILEQRISEICNVPVVVKNPHTKEEVFHLRIIRPNTTDHNPLHRDIWQEENKDAINLFVPIIGCNELSSLPLVPGSHKWPESYTERTKKGAIVNNIKFNVPGLTQSKKELNIIRPNPKRNEVLVFSPYLIHGGAINLNDHLTRISLEVRLWRKME
ncbi:phytanoyl-CoA dioxygenase family protein [Fulvivirgaceae bacterium BMA10]|uniref:Phytanoyl-CoA dioxygenase family protein n=1 Tax=Splendidivirga corallicola TaxID=3051826 RepID=A0ABT8KRK3_9BACT|nr:phytanoyl-CoA dioxygenase family protein [Fulvivirgaceae bacterium BMA10]